MNNGPIPVYLFEIHLQIAQVFNGLKFIFFGLLIFYQHIFTFTDIHNRLIIMKLKYFYVLTLFNNVPEIYLYVISDTLLCVVSQKGKHLKVI